MTAVRVLLADDHAIVRNGLSALLGSLEGITVVATAANGEEAVREAVLHRPDVVLMDVAMPGAGGVEATRQITARSPQTAVLMLTMFDDDESVLAAIRAGARGYLLKDADQEELERAIRSVAAGEAIFGSGVVRRLLGLVAAPAAGQAPQRFPGLTQRERDVLDAIASGLSNSAIARRLDIAPKTVSNHITNLFLKLQVTSRAEAIVLARDAGLGGR
ncbi:MAG: response regulator transcription factor [Sporichthyaceae bacterium]|nr:response regulator transcription factor [Sporichthyaceae bacterium]